MTESSIDRKKEALPCQKIAASSPGAGLLFPCSELNCFVPQNQNFEFPVPKITFVPLSFRLVVVLYILHTYTALRCKPAFIRSKIYPFFTGSILSTGKGDYHFFHLQHLAPNLNNPSSMGLGPGIEWLLKLRFQDESKTGGGIC